MPDFIVHLGAFLERLIGIPAVILIAVPLLVAMSVRFWPKPDGGLEVLFGRALLALLAVCGVGLSLRYLALLLQGDLAQADLRLSDLERGGMLVLLAFATGAAGVHALRSAFGAARQAPPPVPAAALPEDPDSGAAGRQ